VHDFFPQETARGGSPLAQPGAEVWRTLILCRPQSHQKAVNVEPIIVFFSGSE